MAKWDPDQTDRLFDLFDKLLEAQSRAERLEGILEEKNNTIKALQKRVDESEKLIEEMGEKLSA